MSIDNATPEEWDRCARAAQKAAKWAETGFSLETLNAHLARPFGEVALVDRCLAFALWQQGHPVEYCDERAVWQRTNAPQWPARGRYRVSPKPEEIALPSIDWSHVAPKWRWLSCDSLGASMWTHEPKPVAGHWELDCGIRVNAIGFASLNVGRGDWRKMIAQRPEGA